MSEKPNAVMKVDGLEVGGVREVAVYAPPNSNAIKAKEAKEAETVTQKTEPKKPKQSLGSFFKGFGKGFLDHIVLPGLKKLGFEIIKSANNDVVNRLGDFIFQGEKKPETGGGNTAYDKKFTGGNSETTINGVKRLRVVGHSLELVMESEERANAALRFMFGTIDQKGYVSIGDLYEYLGRTPQFTYNKWGWANLIGAGVRQISEGWYVDVPDVRPL